MFSFVPINLHRRWSRECKRSIPDSIKIALGIGNCVPWKYCLAVADSHSLFRMPINAQCPIAKAAFTELGVKEL